MNNMPGKRKCSNCRRPGHDIRTCFKQSFGKTYKGLQEYIQYVRFGVLPLIKKKYKIVEYNNEVKQLRFITEENIEETTTGELKFNETDIYSVAILPV